MIEQELKDFLKEWRNESPTISVKTSGSTGTPKLLKVEKKRMLNSARMTCDFLRLKSGDSALLCMPLQYIAGKMMVVRAEERNLKLITTEPSGHPLAGLNPFPHIDFAAMVPMQVWNSIQVSSEREKLASIRHIIIGGGAIHPELEAELRSFPNAIWSSYGMTETLSHIALRRLSGSEASEWYTILPLRDEAGHDSPIKVSQNESDGSLIIEAPALCSEVLHTHDVVEFQKSGKGGISGFKILGRTDNIVCSGGIKIQIEEVELALHPIFGDTFLITSVPDEKFGEILVMLTTQAVDEHLLRSSLPHPYWMPKRIIRVEKLPQTGSGKPDRAQARITASQAIDKA